MVDHGFTMQRSDYKLFVEAVYILSKRSIKPSELERADANLKAFVGD
jgi:hypothetical protein